MSDSNAIVLPIDFSELSMAAVPWAKRMAAVTNGPVHCVYTVEPPQVYSALDMAPAIPLPTTDELTASAKTQLETFAAENLAGVDAVCNVLIGKPSEQIVEYANEIGAEVIVMTTHGYSGIEHVVLGSTTESVLRHSNCPVLSIRNK
ncbi:MAG: universal stress protein [Gammaproteobacteria bacterium]|nr:universal stress protein [Gammaproteobacteria bacterium]MBT8443685.1 universal stress protein [Gammaproteobacteria bacterium]